MKKLIASLLLAFVTCQFVGVENAEAGKRRQDRQRAKAAAYQKSKAEGNFDNYKAYKKEAILNKKIARAEKRGKAGKLFGGYNKAARLQRKAAGLREQSAPEPVSTGSSSTSANH